MMRRGRKKETKEEMAQATKKKGWDPYQSAEDAPSGQMKSEAAPQHDPSSGNGRGGRARKSAATKLSGPTERSVTASGHQRLGELLTSDNVISEQQLNEALLQQSVTEKRIGALLVEIGALDEANLAAAIGHQANIPIADLRENDPQADALALIPESIARSTNSIPIRLTDEGIELAIADPFDEETLTRLSTTVSGRKLLLFVAPPSDIRRTIDRSYRALTGIETHIKEFQAVELRRRPEDGAATGVISEEAPVIRVVNLLITQGLRDRASDIHIEPQEGRIRIRYRIDGALHDAVALPENMGPAVVSRIKILGNMNIVERQRPQDGQIEMNIDERPLDIRVSTTPTIHGEKAVLRLLDKSKPLFRLDDLGMPPDMRETFEQLVRAPVGMMMVSGPTGSGKTTTLYSTLNEINDSERNVMTVEDPVEYVFPGINQIQIREAAGITFAGGLKSILRQDPDVILIGEIRDVETARIAVQSALTGHLVLSSIHATDAVSALHRFLDMGIEPFLIASAVTGIVGQRLVRRVCMHCKTTYKPTSEELAFFKQSGGRDKAQFWHGTGCNFCADTGYQERIGVFELLQVSDEMRQLIVRHASHDKLSQQASKQGMRPLRQEATRLVEEGWTTISEVVRTIYTL